MGLWIFATAGAASAAADRFPGRELEEGEREVLKAALVEVEKGRRGRPFSAPGRSSGKQCEAERRAVVAHPSVEAQEGEVRQQ